PVRYPHRASAVDQGAPLEPPARTPALAVLAHVRRQARRPGRTARFPVLSHARAVRRVRGGQGVGGELDRAPGGTELLPGLARERSRRASDRSRAVSRMRIVAFLTDAYGGRGGIAKVNRDLLDAL